MRFLPVWGIRIGDSMTPSEHVAIWKDSPGGMVITLGSRKVVNGPAVEAGWNVEVVASDVWGAFSILWRSYNDIFSPRSADAMLCMVKAETDTIMMTITNVNVNNILAVITMPCNRHGISYTFP